MDYRGAEVIAEIKKPGRVYVSTQLTDDSLTSVQVVKVDLLFQLQSWADSEISQLSAFRDADGHLHVS